MMHTPVAYGIAYIPVPVPVGYSRENTVVTYFRNIKVILARIVLNVTKYLTSNNARVLLVPSTPLDIDASHKI
eukprot:scaffold122950_cov52-Attheya_sp.AAC.1